MTHIVAHKSCADGTASAMILTASLNPQTVQFVSYGSEEHQNIEPSPELIFADFSPHPSRIKEFAEAGVTVLDHHRTFKPYLDIFPKGAVFFADEEKDRGVSGASLAVAYLKSRGLPVSATAEDFARVVGILDTWVREHPHFSEAKDLCEAIRFYPTDMIFHKASSVTLTDSMEAWISRFQSIAPVLALKVQERVLEAKRSMVTFYGTGGLKVGIISGTGDTSSVVDASPEIDVLIGFSYRKEGLVLSLRSRSSFSVGDLAKTVPGGGGHTQAAGCCVRVQTDRCPYYQIREWFSAACHDLFKKSSVDHKPATL